MRTILLTPWWLLEIFGIAKSFRNNPIIGNRVLNRIGLHVARVLLAHAMTNFRWWLLAPLLPPEQRRQFRKNGFLVIRDFLPEQQFARLAAEIRGFHGELRECIQGDTLTLNGFLDDRTLTAYRECRALIENRRFMRLMMYGGAKLRRPLFFVNCIKNGYGAGGGDPQKNSHSDTFHPTMKAWLFIDDVSDDNGPFCFVAGSQNLGWARLKWEYRQSIQGRDLPNRYAQNGSLRIEREELSALGYPAPQSFKVPANTLVMANTRGFHCRGQAPRSSRLALYAYSRSNPFTPYPGVGSRLWSRIEQHVAARLWRHEDKKAEKGGYPASWHLVPSDRLRD